MTQKTEFILSARDETRAAFDSVNSSLTKISGASVNVAQSMKGIGLAAVGLAGVGSLAAFKGQIDTAISSLADLKEASERTGASVESLSALKGVAKIGGRDFAQIESAIIKFNKALHGTDDESKGAGKALAALGLNIQDLRKLSPGEAFVELAKAQEKFADGGGKTAAMLAIIKGEGAAMIPYLHDLAEAQKLVGKATTQQAKDADDYEKNVKRLQASWGSLSRQMAGAVVGPLKDITDWMVTAQKEGGVLMGVWTGLGMAALKIAGVEINPMKRTESDTTEAFNKVLSLKAEINKLSGQIDDGKLTFLGKDAAKRRIENLKSELVGAEAELKSSSRRLGKMAREAVAADQPKDTSLNAKNFGKEGSDKGNGKTSDPANDLIKSLDQQIAVRALDLVTTEKLTKAEKEAAEVQQQLNSGTLKATANQRMLIEGKLAFLVAADKELESQRIFNAELEKADQAMTDHRKKLIESIAAAEYQAEVYGLSESQLSAVTQARLEDAIAIAKANGASEDSIKYLEEELRLRGELTDALIKVDQKRIDQQQKSADELDEFAKSAARNLQSSLADFLFDPFANGTKTMGQQFSEMLRRMAAEAASAALMKNLFGSMGQAGKDGSSGDWGWVGQAVKWAGAFFADGGIMTGSGPVPLRKYAGGGVATSPQLAMFGEGSQPEAYVPLPDGRRIPVSMQGSSGMTINQTIYAGQGTDAAQVRRSAASGARAVLGAISGAKRYG